MSFKFSDDKNHLYSLPGRFSRGKSPVLRFNPFKNILFDDTLDRLKM